MDPEKDADGLYKAMKGLGTDEMAIIKILANRSNAFRQLIKEKFKEKYGKDLIEELKSELSMNFKETVISLFYLPLDFDVYHLYKAMKGIGTDKESLIEVLASRNPADLKQYETKFAEMFKRELIPYIQSEVSGDFQTYLVFLAKGGRNVQEHPDEEKCKEIAKLLKSTNNWDESDFVIKNFLTPSPEEMKIIVQEFHTLTGEVFYLHTNKHFKDKNVQSLISAIAYSSYNPSQYFATRVFKAVDGLGTDDVSLIRIVVARDEIDMPSIKQYYKQMYQRDMIKDIIDDTSSYYQKILVELAGH